MKFLSKLSVLGPGLVWAAAAIGVSHLVQSTRAGALYGFELVIIVLVINLLKYPFFEYAPRYASSTGESLLQGYQRLGKRALYLYLVVTISTMFALQSAVTMVTAGLCSSIFNTSFDINTWVMILLTAAAIIIMVGRYSLLDRLIKIIIICLTLATLIAVVYSFSSGFHPNPDMAKSFAWEYADIVFLIAFAGWMPTAIDVSVWHSYWILAKQKSAERKITLKESLFDFKIGYWGTAVLSLGFLSLGALVMYGTGEQFSSKAGVFASQLISLYTKAIGPWAYILISVAALTTMFSTTLTCLDAYPRVLSPLSQMLVPSMDQKVPAKVLNYFWLSVVGVGALITIRYFASSMKFMVDVATTMSFLTAPVLGWLNYRVVLGENVPSEAKPGKKLKILTWAGLIVLSSFSIYFIIWRFFIH